MIKAFEAKQISLDSEAEVDKVLEDIGICITDAAHKGKRSLSYYKGRCSWRNDNYDEGNTNRLFVNCIIKKLSIHGYNATIAKDKPYLSPSGNEEDPDVYNLFLLIDW